MPSVPLPSVPLPPLPPLWRETAWTLEAAQLVASSVWRGAGVAPGDGRPVLLIPGFLAGDTSLSTLTRWLRAAGYRTRRAGIRANVSCSEDACTRLESRLEELAAAHGRRVAIIGQSRGGIFARALAVRRPDLVSGIVTLGSPTVNQLSVHPVVLGQIAVVAALGSGRLPGMFTWRCLRGTCCEAFNAALHEDVPGDVGYTALYSRTDGVVDWRACLDPSAHERVEVRATHLGMALNAQVYAEIGNALARFGRADAGLPAAA
jgi:pimeloyl-ACP methyl ester carboxylesterase